MQTDQSNLSGAIRAATRQPSLTRLARCYVLREYGNSAATHDEGDRRGRPIVAVI